MGKISSLYLLLKQVLINETVEDRAAVFVAELVELAIRKQSFVAEGFVPVRLQNDMAIDGGDNTVDHLGGDAPRGKIEDREEELEGRENHWRIRMELPSQNG